MSCKAALAIWSPRPDSRKVNRIAPGIVLYGLPVIDIIPRRLSDDEREALSLVEALIFTSHHAVVQCLEQMPLAALQQKVIIAIGRRTAETLRLSRLSPALTAPAPFSSEALLADEAFLCLPCRRFVIVAGGVGRGLLCSVLKSRAKQVQTIKCYQRDKINVPRQIMVEFINKYAISGVLLSSGEIAESVADNVSATAQEQLFDCPAFAFSERIAMRAEASGFKRLIVAEAANQHAVYQRIISWWEGQKP